MTETGSRTPRVNPIIRFAVERRVTMAMAVVGVLVLGWLALSRLPLEFLPTFSSSYITVEAPYRSSSPLETERRIVRPLEDSLSAINGLESVSATATSGSGSVRLAFVAGTDMDLAAVEVRDRVDRVRARLPDDLERVEIFRFQTSDRPVLRLNLSAPWERDRLYRWVDEVLVRRLRRLEGVADVSVRGLEAQEVQIQLRPDRLAAHGIDVRTVSQVLRDHHLAASGGVVREGSERRLVRVEGKLRTLDEIRLLPLGRGLRVADVADVGLAFPRRERFEFLNGEEAVSVRVYKASTANLLAMVDGVKAELEAIAALPGAEGVSLNVYRDDSVDVRQGLDELRTTGLLGGGLAVLFMYLFLRRFRTTFLIAIAIPVSVVMTFVIMYLIRQAGWADLTLNIMSLMGLMLSVGMLVDSSIVVIESIFRHRQELGEAAVPATLHGASEVVMPIAASTLTTMSVFLPMLFLSSGGRFALFMGSIALTVVVVMAASFVVAVTVVPMVAARLLKAECGTTPGLFDRAAGWYVAVLRLTLRHRVVFALVILGLLAWSWRLYQGIERTFQPPSFERQLSIQVDTPSSYSVEQKERLFAEIYAVLDAHRDELDVTDVTYSFDRGGGRSRGFRGSNRFDVYLREVGEGGGDTGRIRDRLEELLPTRAGVVLTVARSRRGHGGSGSGVELRLEGDRPEILERLAGRARDALAALPGLTDVDTSLESGAEEIRLSPDRTRTAALGLSSQAVAASVSSALSSRSVAWVETEDRELPVVVQYREEDRATLDQLLTLPLASRGRWLPIGAVAEVDTAPGVRSISREDRRSSITLTADTASGASSFMAQRQAEGAIRELGLPSGYEVVEGRDWRMGSADAADAVFMLVFALILVYMVMAALFESFAQPFIIMLAVPFAFVGVGLAMRLAAQPRSSSADMGLIILAGIVVNNAIVLVDHINHLRRDGLGRDEAIVLGGRHRLRPIVMTAMTTVLGLSPMVAPFFLPEVFGSVEGRAAFWAPVGLVILGGLTTSTVLTVLVIPTFYSLVDDGATFARRVVRALTAVTAGPSTPASMTAPADGGEGS